MKQFFNISFIIAVLSVTGIARGEHKDRNLFNEAVLPILNAKCASCHGEDKQKGKLRIDSFEAIMKGGSEGTSVVAGKIEESTLLLRVHLPLDDDDHMPPEGKGQLTKEESAVLAFWVKSGAKVDVKIADLKPDDAVNKAIAAVFANPPKGAASKKEENKLALTPAQIKVGQDTMVVIEKSGASLMTIAQDTPELRFSALNVAKEYADKDLALLKPVADQLRWVDLARSKVTDAGLAQIATMKNLTRLHLENTVITDAGIDQLKGLEQLEYLNLYGTAVTDAGVMKLAGMKNLKKLFVWQSKVTDAGAKKLAAAIPGIDVNTGWKAAEAKPVLVASAAPAKPAPAKPAPPTPAKPTTPPAKPTAKPAPKPAPPAPKPAPTTTPPKPAPKPATPAPKPAPKPPVPAPAKPAPAATPFDKALAELTTATEGAQKSVTTAKAEVTKTAAAVAAATKAAEAAKAKLAKSEAVSNEAKGALNQLLKAIEASKK